MKTLSIRNQELISRGLRHEGRKMDAYFYIEEELYVSQAGTIYKFLEWLFKIDRPYGPANAQERWAEFMRGDQPPAEYFDFVMVSKHSLPGFGGKPFISESKNKQRMVENTLEHAGLIMYGKNTELPWKFSIENQDGEVVKEFTTEEVFGEMSKLDAEWEKKNRDERMAFHDYRHGFNYGY